MGSESALARLLNRTLCPLALMLLVPNLVVWFWYAITYHDGSFGAMFAALLGGGDGAVHGLASVWGRVSRPSTPVVAVFLAYGLYAVVAMVVLPGRKVKGPLTPKGNVPVYTDNGFAHYLLTLALFAVITYVCKSQYGVSPSMLYDRFDEVLFLLNAFSLVFCLGLYLKGIYAPSSSDCGSSGNPVFDYYWGTELYPRVCGVDVKVFTNCRFGMTVWALLVCVHALKSYELHGGVVDSMAVSAALQLLYISKFFWWEVGYLSTIDIMVDRAGFYICWGCLVFVPGFYTSPSAYLVTHPVHLGAPLAAAILLLGALSIWVNFDADDQKQRVRATDGECKIWGRKPEIIRAKYRIEGGAEKSSVLLAAGWWGLARHFHYVPEVALAFFWSVPALFSHIMPYIYVIYLVILLWHRSFRDEDKCSRKYGQHWEQYRKAVPWRVVPYVF